jgi:N-methylhydantoinase A
MRFAVDIGGTFTDLIVEDDSGGRRMFKSSTTPEDPVLGMLEALELAAAAYRIPRCELLARGTHFIHGTTHAINAIITGRTARTAFLTSAGHPDILVLREGGRTEPFNFELPYPPPYVPRSLTFEISGRIRPDGSEMEPLNEAQVLEVLQQARAAGAEAIAVCLLWSIVNPKHEERVGELIERHLASVPHTLSHRLNPVIREFRRASSSVIDASLKPLMGVYMRGLEQRLREAGFPARVLIVTSQAGVIDARDAAETPIRIVNSGPSMAPVAGRWFGRVDEQADTIIVADTGGTSYDVSLVRNGIIPVTRDTWIGQQYSGTMVGFPWVDVRSIGAGGGSTAYVDTGGMLHVGPQSAGAVPGPVCYGRGGRLPTVTDASLVLGHLDPAFFLGGAMPLDLKAASAAIAAEIGDPLGRDVTEAASAIIEVATENMAQAIVDITVNQGIDPRSAVLVGGGGAAGLNSVKIARRLGCRRVLIPAVGAALSAAGALMSDLRADYDQAFVTTTQRFDFEGVNRVLAGLGKRCEEFIRTSGAGSSASSVRYTAQARYTTQVWEIETRLPCDSFGSARDLERLVEEFHRTHEELFGFADRESPVEIIGWSAHASCRLARGEEMRLQESAVSRAVRQRRAYFSPSGWTLVQVHALEAVQSGTEIRGPAIVESAFTTIVIDPGATAVRRPSGSLSIDVRSES